MVRALGALLALVSISAVQAACLSARESKPQDWYAWAKVLVAADVTGVSQRSRYDVLALRVVEPFKGPQLVETLTLEVPSTFWQGCKLERPKAGDRVLAALNASNDANVVPLDASYADQLRAAKPADAIVAAPAPKAAAAAVRCVESPVYGATVKVESCEPAGGGMFLRGELVRAVRENSAAAVAGLPVPESGRKYALFKPSGKCSDFEKNNA
ncbi:MAG TPA: hypothetical protein VEU32_14410, partial [Burkholderiales bacterium]|nr:hypothetical protein [Burkholderiales bacterium]